MTHKELKAIHDACSAQMIHEPEDGFAKVFAVLTNVLDRLPTIDSPSNEEIEELFRSAVSDIIESWSEPETGTVTSYLVEVKFVLPTGRFDYREIEFSQEEDAQAYATEQWQDPNVLSTKIIPIVTCCGEEMACAHFTNTCNQCGADYNRNGHLLAPRSQWEDAY